MATATENRTHTVFALHHPSYVQKRDIGSTDIGHEPIVEPRFSAAKNTATDRRELLFEASIPHIAYAALGGFVVLFGMFSLLLREKLYIGEACWAFLFGVVMGPYGANIFNPRGWGGDNEDTVNTITLELTRVVLAIGVFAIGVELPKAYMRRHWKSLFFLLGPVMIWVRLVYCGGIHFLMIPGLDFLSSLAVAACLTPTDPILVGGKYADKHVPAHIRHLLAAESGYQVILGVVIGSLIGFAFRHMMKFSERHSLIDRHSYVAQYASLALLTIVLTTLLGSDDLLSAFAWDGFFNRQAEESVFSSVIDLLFNVGAWMPFSSFQDPSGTTLEVWRLVVLAICVFLLRRLPIMVALYRWIPDIKTFREAVFSGHFGPIGVGAVFISTLATQVLQESALSTENDQIALLMKTIQPICAFMVLCSITIHGLSIPSFSLGRRVHSVSRTWSRHTAATATHPQQPDWMDHVRHAGGGVVVNRDHEADRGRGDGAGERGGPVEAGTRAEGDVPPDGEELVSEWQEGHHRIIERRAGPGEEVEVEVVRNVDGEHVSSAYRGSKAVRIEEQLAHSPILGHMHMHHPHPPAHGDGDEDEEGWASDASGGDGDAPVAGPSSSPSPDRGDRRKRSRSPKITPANMRQRAARARATVHARPPPARGGVVPILLRTSTCTAGSIGPPVLCVLVHACDGHDFAYPRPVPAESAPRQGRPSRVNSLRLQHPTCASREASPARSVRFAEEGGPRSRTSTPLVSVFGEDAHAAPAPMTADNPEDNGGERGKGVTFDLPDSSPSGSARGRGERDRDSEKGVAVF
ncbi:Sodium/hydrogen exchanger family-domain-containing protein [Mycena maculata]|uniref:Sodium/hydrogen exchanger family-domain-containing protein n=1 Tax=Mycena maculata TaxID=230809 RepID=A0AAD7NKC1_9AGAR|nr:Sodium/hydrogen exchanger family-domain-containing protein [Mycena maculata]